MPFRRFRYSASEETHFYIIAGGHYTATVLRSTYKHNEQRIEKSWLLCNDANVTAAPMHARTHRGKEIRTYADVRV